MADSATGARSEAPLDDIMLAMDVVDTLRHREHVIDRELNEDAREADLLERLKKIYAAQGIEVPERILKEGIQGLKEQRFVYEPPAASLQTTLARLYVGRRRWGKVAAAAVIGLVVLWGGYTFIYELPAERAAEAARIELAKEIPARLRTLAAEVSVIARAQEVKNQAQELRNTGVRAATAGDRGRAVAAIDSLEALQIRLERQYVIRIVQGAGEQSGVWRIPDVNQDARNYYLIVEAVTPGGSRLAVPVKNEETGKVTTVTRWGQRVSESAFNTIRRDKSDDGIIQGDVIGEKKRGELDPEFSFPVENGAITEW